MVFMMEMVYLCCVCVCAGFCGAVTHERSWSRVNRVDSRHDAASARTTAPPFNRRASPLRHSVSDRSAA